MNWKKTACLVIALLISVPNISYAEEIEYNTEVREEEGSGPAQDETFETEPNTEQSTEQNTESNEEPDTNGAPAGDTDGSPVSGEDTQENAAGGETESRQPEEAAEQGDKEVIESGKDGYVIWGKGRGITSATQSSSNDRFAAISAGLAIVAPEGILKSRIEEYLRENGEDFGSLVSTGQIKGTKTAYYEYKTAMVFTSDYGTYCIQMPMLNVFITSGGIESVGAPVAEQTVDNGYIYQKFEKGTLSCEVEKNTDTLVVRRGNTYYFKYSLGDGEADKVVKYGRSGDTVLIGDWDGDGLDTLCVRRGNAYYFKNSISSGAADYEVKYGRAGDEVLVGDWNGDGKDTLCVRRGNTYYFKDSITSGAADSEIKYGKKSDNVLVGDWNGDAYDTLCVRRGNAYHIKNSISGGAADAVVKYGRAGDSVLIGDWNGDGSDTICVRRQNTYYIKNSIQDGAADITIRYGKAKDITYAGKWAVDDKAAKTNAQNLSFNQSHGFQYSQLTQGYADNSVNVAAFRKSALASYIDGAGNQIQYCAYYDLNGTIVLAKRSNSGVWEYQWTSYKGDYKDAHNVVSIAVDGRGYLHMAWSQHSGQLMYAKSSEPGSMNMSSMQMIGSLEDRVTYPEFYVQPSGDMFFLYRNGSSGNGNIVLNKYNAAAGNWQRVQDNLISGEGRVSPYWQACVDSTGRLHISWVWRETGNVVTNYNMSYTVSTDASGSSFVNSLGQAQTLPITEASAELVCEIPENSSLINQTSMTTDDEGKPYIISYWRVDGVVQYNIIRYTGTQWIIYNTDIRTSDFDLAGIGTRQLPCARPQILVDGTGDNARIYVLFRDDERGGKASIAKLSVQGTEITTEKMIDITGESLEEWEPGYDIALWQQSRRLNIFLQKAYFHADGTDKKENAEYIYVIDTTSFLDE